MRGTVERAKRDGRPDSIGASGKSLASKSQSDRWLPGNAGTAKMIAFQRLMIRRAATRRNRLAGSNGEASHCTIH
jgi:hypothetical protein